MRSIETSFAFPLSAVKPLDNIIAYRQFCIDRVRPTVHEPVQRRSTCEACESPTEFWGAIDDLNYVRCQRCASLFLQYLPSEAEWNEVLSAVSHRRNSAEMQKGDIAQSRTENVYAPKLDWIHNTLRLHNVLNPGIAEITTLPSPFTTLLKGSSSFASVKIIEESRLMTSPVDHSFEAAILLESLDRAHNPAGLLAAVNKRLRGPGLVFITALVASGFDMLVLGNRNKYLYPPDRANCFSLDGLERLLLRMGFKLVELSTPGVLDVEIVTAHRSLLPDLELSGFEQRLLTASAETLGAFQSFLQQNRLSSFARIVARKGQ